MGQAACRCNEIRDQHELDMSNEDNNTVLREMILDFNKNETFAQLEKYAVEFLKKHGILLQYSAIVSRVFANKQNHLLKYFNEFFLNEQKSGYLTFLSTLDYENLDSLYYNLQQEPVMAVKKPREHQKVFFRGGGCNNFVDTTTFSMKLEEKYRSIGLNLIAQNKTAAVILTSSNTLQNDLFSLIDIGFNNKKTLLQVIFERLKRVKDMADAMFVTKVSALTNNNNKSNQYNNTFKVFVVANDKSLEEITCYLLENQYFGLPKESICIFSQQSNPVISAEGKIVLSEKNKILFSSNGKGGVFKSFATGNVFKDIRVNQIEYLHIFGIENVLVKPLDPVMLGYAANKRLDVTIKCCNAEECDHFYNELDEQQFQQQQQNSNSTLKSKPSSQLSANSLSGASASFSLLSGHNNSRVSTLQDKDEIMDNTSTSPQNVSQAVPLRNLNNVVLSTDFLEDVYQNFQKRSELLNNFKLVPHLAKAFDHNIDKKVDKLPVLMVELKLLDIVHFTINFGLFQVPIREEGIEIEEINTDHFKHILQLVPAGWTDSSGASFDFQSQNQHFVFPSYSIPAINKTVDIQPINLQSVQSQQKISILNNQTETSSKPVFNIATSTFT